MNNSETNITELFALDAAKLIATGDYAEATGMLRSGIKEYPNYLSAYLLLRKSLESLGKQEDVSEISDCIEYRFRHSRLYSAIRKAKTDPVDKVIKTAEETAPVREEVPEISLPSGETKPQPKLPENSQTPDSANPYDKYKNMKGFARKLGDYVPLDVNSRNGLRRESSRTLGLIPGLDSNPVTDKSFVPEYFGISTDSLPVMPDFKINNQSFTVADSSTIISEIATGLNSDPAEKSQETKKPEGKKVPMITETLANILVSQGAFKEAVSAFKTLMKNNSGDKKQYFEDKIKDAEAKLAEFEEMKPEEKNTKNKTKRKTYKKGKTK